MNTGSYYPAIPLLHIFTQEKCLLIVPGYIYKNVHKSTIWNLKKTGCNLSVYLYIVVTVKFYSAEL